MKRTFIYADDKSNKFWTIEVSGNSYTVNYGKAGTAGQTQSKDFADEATCQKAVEKLIAEKTKKGYVESDGMPNATDTNNETSKKIIVKANTTSGYGYLVNLDDEKSIENTLIAVIKHLDSDEVTERIDEGDHLYPEFGKMEAGEFIKHNEQQDRSSEDRFFGAAVSYPKLRPLVIKYVKKIIKLNNEYDAVWADDEMQAGVNAAFNLVMASEEYLPLYVELTKTCADGEHDVYQYEYAETILKKYGWKAETLAVAIERILVDMYANELFKTDEAKEFLLKDENVNTLIKSFFAEIKGTHFADGDFHYKSFAKIIFPNDIAEEYGVLLFNYAQQGKTPTVAVLKKGNIVDNGSKKIKYTFRDYTDRVNEALQRLGMGDLNKNNDYSTKISGSNGKSYYAGVIISEKNPVLNMYLSGISLKQNPNEEAKLETFRLFNDIYLMLPPDLTEFMYMPCYSTIAAANSIKAFTPDLTSEMVEKQFCSLFGFTNYMAKELQLVNAGKKTSDEVKNAILTMANSTEPPQSVNSAFEETLKKYIEKTKTLTILRHDSDSHSFCIECNNPKTGTKAFGVVTHHPLSQKVSITLPCYQGDMKGRHEEVYEWCEQATKQISGHVIVNSGNNYVMVRNIVDEYTITDAKSLQKLLLFDLIDCFAPALAKGVQRIIDGEEPMDVLHDQLVYTERENEIVLPSDLKELGIYGEQGERMLIAFSRYGKEFLVK